MVWSQEWLEISSDAHRAGGTLAHEVVEARSRIFAGINGNGGLWRDHEGV
jgi:hypothetical protein